MPHVLVVRTPVVIQMVWEQIVSQIKQINLCELVKITCALTDAEIISCDATIALHKLCMTFII